MNIDDIRALLNDIESDRVERTISATNTDKFGQAKEAEKYGISPTIAVSRYKHDTNWYRTSAYKSSKIY